MRLPLYYRNGDLREKLKISIFVATTLSFSSFLNLENNMLLKIVQD